MFLSIEISLKKIIPIEFLVLLAEILFILHRRIFPQLRVTALRSDLDREAQRLS